MGRRKPAAPCSISGCEKPRRKNGYCNAHNLRFKRYGDPLAPRLRAPRCLTREESDARRREAQRNHYHRNKEQYKARAKLWRENNPEARAAQRAAYKPGEDVIQRVRAARKAWREKNIQHERKRHLEYKAANRDKVRAYRASYRASLLRATPPWLTKEHKRAIAAVYKRAFTLSKETGIEHHVDHIVPLKGGTVCGLHVPWNLRAITAEENWKRPRVWRGEGTDGKDTCVAALRGEEPEGWSEREGARVLQPGEPGQAGAQASATRGRGAS